MFDESLDEASKSDEWKGHLNTILDIVLKLENDGRRAEFKSGGQGGENIHDYSVSEIRKRAKVKIKKFMICLHTLPCHPGPP